MKTILLIITFLIFSADTYSQEYKGEIFFKDNHSINAKDINLHRDNITFRIGRKSIIDTVDNSKIDYLIVNDGSYIMESMLGGALGGALGFYLVRGDDSEGSEIYLNMVMGSISGLITGAFLRKKKRIDFYEDDDDIDISFINKASIMPLTNVVNYQLVSISVGL